MCKVVSGLSRARKRGVCSQRQKDSIRMKSSQCELRLYGKSEKQSRNDSIYCELAVFKWSEEGKGGSREF